MKDWLTNRIEELGREAVQLSTWLHVMTGLVQLEPIEASPWRSGVSLWSLKSGLYHDLDGAAWRAIADDDEVEAAKPPI